MEEGLDTGGVYARREVPIGAETTAAELRAELVEVGTALLVDTLARPLEDWIDQPEPQVGEVTYAAKFTGSRLRDRLVEAGRRDPPTRSASAAPGRRSGASVSRSTPPGSTTGRSSRRWCNPKESLR